jgi:uncharacterized repeat protein (TIGR01451 family)
VEKPREASTVVFVPWTPPTDSAGPQQVQATVDPSGDLEEYTKVDNQANTTIDVQPLRIPDLSFESDELTIESVDADMRTEAEGTLRTYAAPAGSLVRVSVPVTNTGNSAATLVDARLFYGSLALPAERIDRLAPGETREVSFTFLAADGTRELSLEISSNARDLDPSDNTLPQEGRIRLQGLSFDVGLSPTEPIQLDEPGQTTQTELELTNRAGVGVLVRLAIQAPDGIELDPEVEQVYLEPGATETVPAEVRTQPTAPGGTHSVAITIQGEGDDVQRTSVPVTIEPRHELSLSLGQTQLAPGAAQLPVEITNRGNLDEAITLQARLDGVNVTDPTRVHVPRDVPRTVPLTVEVPAGTEPGDATLTIEAEGTATRTWNRTVTVPAEPRLEIATVGEDARLNPDGVQVPIEASNAGTAPIEAQLVPDPLQAPDMARVEPSTLELAPGQTRNASLVAPPSTSEPLPVTVDAPGAENLEVPIPQATSDLAIVRQTIDPEDPKPGQPVELRTTVANTGNTTAHQVPVDLFIDEEFAARQTIDTLEPTATRTVTFEWPAFPGEHVASTVVDPDDRFPDATEDDDRANLHVAAGETGLLSQMLQVPAPGVLVVPLIVATAVLLPRIRFTDRGGEN